MGVGRGAEVRALRRALDWLTLNNVLHLPSRAHYGLVRIANRLAERED